MNNNEFLTSNIEFLTKIEKFLEINGLDRLLIDRIMHEIVTEASRFGSPVKDRYSGLLFLKNLLEKILQPFDVQMNLSLTPSIVLVAGINGTGKTNTVAKMSNLLCNLDYKTMIIECDNFRQGTFENLTQITKKNKNIKIFYKEEQEKITKLIKRGYDFCIENKYDVCIVDTSGRMSDNKNLMNEIVNIKEYLKDLNKSYPHETVFILDATLGLAVIDQIKVFHEKLKITGIILTKTDLSKNTGIVIAVCKKYNISIYGVTKGNNIQDIEPFDIKKYINDFCEPIRKFI